MSVWLVLWAVTLIITPVTVLAHPITDLQSPQSMVVAPGTGYFIANANGDPGQADNHGFISKLDQNGHLIDLHYIYDGRNQVVLHSPTGMALLNHTLYVADIDTVRGFDLSTGKPTLNVPLRRYNCRSLAGLTANREGLLYVSDMESNAIYRIDPAQDHAVTLLVQDPSLSGPRGLAVHPRSGHLVGVSWNNGKIFSVDEKGAITTLMANTFFSRRFQNLDGIDFDQYGTMYVSDFTAGKIWRIRQDLKKDVIAEFLISPAGISIDREKHLILVPYVYANGAEINGLERPSNAGTKRKRRSLSDYGLDWLNKK